jgi:hypothetical protein
VRGAALVVVVASAACTAPDPFATRVVSVHIGENGGFHKDELPGVVLGPPQGGGETEGGLDVLSLGTNGSIVLEMGEEIVDEDGVDLIVFENPFKLATGAVDGEAGEVSVSDDGENFTAFPCEKTKAPPNGCAGFAPVLSSTTNHIDPTDAKTAGGDQFDLHDIGVARAKFVKIVDQGNLGPAPKAGFDLDAVAAANHAH